MKKLIIKIKQLFCRHKDSSWYAVKGNIFQMINGEKRLLVCNECGKTLAEIFVEYEGNGFK